MTDAAAPIAPPRAPSVLVLAWPLVLSFWMRQLFTFVDTYFAASLGDAAVAGIGLAYPFEFLLIACWVGTSTGMTSLVSRAMGAHEGERLDQVVAVTRRIVNALVVVFLALGAAIWLWPRAFLDEGLGDEVVAHFRTYAAVIVAGTAATGFWSIVPDSLVKAHHDTKATMWAGVASNLVNVALNALFLYVFHWGMFGIAFSTVLGRLAGLAYALAVAARHESRRRDEGLDVRPGREPRPLRAILALALPAAATYVLMAAETRIVNGLLSRTENPTASLAAYSIHFRYLMFFLMPVVATGVALLPFTARLWGRGDLGGIRRGMRDVTLAALAYVLLLVTPAVLLLRRALVAPLANEPLTRELAQDCLALAPLACVVAIPFFACRPVFEGMQRGAPGLAMAVLRYAVLTWPLALLGAALAPRLGHHPVVGVVAGLVAAAAIASTALAAWTLRTLRRAEASRPADGPVPGSAAG